MELKIEYLPVDLLKPYERNARLHQPDDIDAICESIKEFGFDDPIGIWSDRNVIVEGHGRLMAAKKLGMTEVPCIRLDHLTDEQRSLFEKLAVSLGTETTVGGKTTFWDRLKEVISGE